MQNGGHSAMQIINIVLDTADYVVTTIQGHFSSTASIVGRSLDRFNIREL